MAKRRFAYLLLGAGIVAAGWVARAQTVQPVIVEYKGKAEGKLALTNTTEVPMAVVLEPKSFSIGADGRGIFRELDAGIHLELSSMSVKLQPRQTYYVFYSVTADKLPAWFTVYATFSQVKHGAGLDLRIMLPHTVYLYQKQALAEADVEVRSATYSARSRTIICTLENVGASLARVQEVKATGSHAEAEASGFPFLPGGLRRLEIEWKSAAPPEEIALRFDHFTVKKPLAPSDD